ncbi:MAG: DNA topology modulation protein [Clostridiales bacterium]|jgi:adenylate kinase family enzyme|nr:DNA topology modulation protein [Clostridiales bacterium]
MKIAIIGYSGSGKSTLAEIIGKKYSIPVLHLDKVNFLPGWVERNIDESRRIAEEFMKKDSWVIDGNYGKFFQKERLEAADRIIFLDFNRFSCLLRAYRRYIIHKGKTRSSAAEGCIEKFDGVFIRWILADGRTKAKRDYFKSVLKMHGHKTVVIKNQRQLDLFLNRRMDYYVMG